MPGDSSICRFDYDPQITAIPNEQRLQTWGRVDWDRGDTGNIWAELRYASNDIDRDVSPSFPVLNTPIVPAYHPGNPFGEDVFFQGRPYGYGQPPEVNFYEHDTARLSAGIEGRFTDTASWNVSMVRAQNDTLQNPHDVVVANFQAALLGFGGSDCNANPLDAGPEQAGAGGCLFFNPFSSSFAAGPGEALHNSPALRPFIIGDYFGDGRSQLTTLEANVTGFLPWRDAGYAAGVQYRDQSLDFMHNQQPWANRSGKPGLSRGRPGRFSRTASTDGTTSPSAARRRPIAAQARSPRRGTQHAIRNPPRPSRTRPRTAAAPPVAPQGK